MPAHRKKGKRRKADFYPTPYEVALAFVMCLEVAPDARVLEAGAGDGVFVQALYDVHGVKAHALELHEKDHPALLDAPCASITWGRFEDHFPAEPYDLVLGNPPFSIALEFVRHALFCLKQGGRLAYVLPTSFSHTWERAPFIRESPPRLKLGFTERPPFDPDLGSNTNSAEYAGYVFERGYQGYTIEEPLAWKHVDCRNADVQRIRERHWHGVDCGRRVECGRRTT